MILVDRDTFPTLRRAFEMIECDSGAHLIGIVYPGIPINLDTFHLPGYPHYMVAMAEEALSRLSTPDLETFVIGDQGEADRLLEAAEAKPSGNLALRHARDILNDFFNDFEPTDEEKDG